MAGIVRTHNRSSHPRACYTVTRKHVLCQAPLHLSLTASSTTPSRKLLPMPVKLSLQHDRILPTPYRARITPGYTQLPRVIPHLPHFRLLGLQMPRTPNKSAKNP